MHNKLTTLVIISIIPDLTFFPFSILKASVLANAIIATIALNTPPIKNNILKNTCLKVAIKFYCLFYY